MMDYNQMGAPGYDFAAMPRVISTKPKYKDPYGGPEQEQVNLRDKLQREYYPANIMYDRRIARGSTYAAMVIPAGTNPDTMLMERKQEERRRKTMKGSMGYTQQRAIYPNRDVPSPEPVPGRVHMEIQTAKYVEQLTDKPPEREQGVATEFYLDRPPIPLFKPKMPAKENCKFTQIFDQDPELFDFDEEIEPMLNVLCSKTLEQARMEVLEEEELKIIKLQRQEYEEVRNAELVEAQRWEAQELRKKQEIERRKVQQRARKEEKKAAHQKFIARIMSKRMLAGIKEKSLRALYDQGILTQPREQVIHEQVYPWLLKQMIGNLEEQPSYLVNVHQAIDQGYEQALKRHANAIKKEYERRKKVEQDKVTADKKKVSDKLGRKKERQRLRKQEELRKFKEEIKATFVDKGDVKEHILNMDIVDINGQFIPGRSIPGTLGGHTFQMMLVLSGLMSTFKKHPDFKMLKDLIMDKKKLIELLISYLKDIKQDHIIIYLHPEAIKELQDLKVAVNEIQKQKDDMKSQVARVLFTNNAITPESKIGMKGFKFEVFAFTDMWEAMCDLITKNIPEDMGISSTKLDNIVGKFKFVPLNEEQFGDKKIKERAMVRILLPKKPVVHVEKQVEPEESEKEGTQTIDKDDIYGVGDLEDKVKLVIPRVEGVDYHVGVINQVVQRFARNDFLTHFWKFYASVLENQSIDDAMKQVEEEALEFEEQYLKAECNEDKCPLFDFEFNLDERD